MPAIQFTNFTPAIGTPLTPFQGVDFDLESTNPLTVYAVYVEGPGYPAAEMVWDAATGTFGPAYAQQSTKTVIPSTNGFHFHLVRFGGWLGSPTFHGIAADNAGNSATL